MRLHSNLSEGDNGEIFYEGVDIRWDLTLHGDDKLKDLELEAGTFYAKHARNRAYINNNEKLGKSWMACSPKLLEENMDRFPSKKTRYSFYYWLNYGDGTTYGAFTVEEIQRWLSEDDLLLIDIEGAGGNDEYPKKTLELREQYKKRGKGNKNELCIIPMYENKLYGSYLKKNEVAVYVSDISQCIWNLEDVAEYNKGKVVMLSDPSLQFLLKERLKQEEANRDRAERDLESSTKAITILKSVL